MKIEMKFWVGVLISGAVILYIFLYWGLGEITDETGWRVIAALALEALLPAFGLGLLFGITYARGVNRGLDVRGQTIRREKQPEKVIQKPPSPETPILDELMRVGIRPGSTGHRRPTERHQPPEQIDL